MALDIPFTGATLRTVGRPHSPFIQTWYPYVFTLGPPTVMRWSTPFGLLVVRFLPTVAMTFTLGAQGSMTTSWTSRGAHAHQNIPVSSKSGLTYTDISRLFIRINPSSDKIPRPRPPPPYQLQTLPPLPLVFSKLSRYLMRTFRLLLFLIICSHDSLRRLKPCVAFPAYRITLPTYVSSFPLRSSVYR